ncbi:MAG: putative PEP-binding protein, partial [Nitratireductor sp.]
DQGQVLVGEHEMVQPELSGSFAILMQWADEFRRMKVRSNAEKATDAKLSTAFGAEGIGLCRTEHMFFEGERIVAVREMILAKNEEGRRIALSKLLPMQRQDFYDLFEIMAGRPLNIRLLDPPLHEFLPQTAVEMERVAIAMGISVERLKRRAQDLKEVNPMLGLRGCRLAISYPEIAEMQTRAIFEAAADLFNKTGISPEIEIMVPLVSLSREYKFVHKTIMNIANEVMAKTKVQLEYSVGTMIELPRAALRGDELAKSAEFFSFGTNDLTQTTFGISRDDSPQFLQRYQAGKIVDQDPFAKIDELGVGNLMEIAMERGGSTNPKLKFGACGEHAGDPTSIDFFERIKMDYISCSPYRVPIARLAAAQAALKYKKN